MNKLSNAKGFTLIELVVVIVILGILAATAAPKFIDLTSDAREAVMEGVEGSIESAVSMVHAKALVQGKASGTDTVVIDGLFYAVVNGYPKAASAGNGSGNVAGNAIGILGLVDIDSTANGDFDITNATPALIQHKGATTANGCRISYPDSAGANQRPNVVFDPAGC